MTGPADKGRPVEQEGLVTERLQSTPKVDLVASDRAEPQKTGKNHKRRRSRGKTAGRGPRRSSKDGSGGRSVGGEQKSSRKNSPPVYAALDLGTNNCRLLVARPSRRGFLVVDAFSRIIRLGEGVSTSGRLSEAAMKRTIDALQVCSKKMQRRSVKRSRLIATQACRIAENADEFIDRVYEKNWA